MVKKLLKDLYALSALNIEKSAVGAGSEIYFITTDHGKYVLKFPCESEMNHPEAEPVLCDFLLSKGLSVSEFVHNRLGEFISYDENGRKVHLQKFVDGRMYGLNTAPKWLLKESAQMLGKIHSALVDYQGLPEGIGKNFFKYITPAYALNSYKATQKMANERGDKEIVADLSYRMELMARFPSCDINVDQLSCRCTHGDYFISQLICGEDKINAVIDWTTACIHPVVWEIIRSYVYAAPSCTNGEINIPEFTEYVAEYLVYAPLNKHDIEMMAKLFYYQISVCDYYNQYYLSTADNRHIYLDQAVFSTKLMKWFEKNMDTLTDVLLDRFAKHS